MTKMPSTVVCIEQLVEHVPELGPAYNEHVHDYDELLPHVFLGDVTRFVVHQVRSSGETGPSKPVERILQSLERWMAAGDEQLNELVSVSFIENLAEYDDVLASLTGLIGPNLESELRKHGK